MYTKRNYLRTDNTKINLQDNAKLKLTSSSRSNSSSPIENREDILQLDTIDCKFGFH